MENFKSTFVENMIFYRTQKNLSQVELALLCECGKSTISGIESKKNFPSFELLLKIAQALEIHPADLFLRNASKTKQENKKFFNEKFLPKIKEMLEENF